MPPLSCAQRRGGHGGSTRLPPRGPDRDPGRRRPGRGGHLAPRRRPAGPCRPAGRARDRPPVPRGAHTDGTARRHTCRRGAARRHRGHGRPAQCDGHRPGDGGRRDRADPGLRHVAGGLGARPPPRPASHTRRGRRRRRGGRGAEHRGGEPTRVRPHGLTGGRERRGEIRPHRVAGGTRHERAAPVRLRSQGPSGGPLHGAGGHRRGARPGAAGGGTQPPVDVPLRAERRRPWPLRIEAVTTDGRTLEVRQPLERP